jgi:peroxiredoxin
MKRTLLLACTLLVGLSFGQEFKVGSRISDFALTDLQGQAVNYSALKGDTTVILFVSTKCPVSNGYNDRMKALFSDYSPKGVHFVFINSNNGEGAAEIAQHAKDHGFQFQVYKDQGNVIAGRFGAQVTPESFVVDRSGTIRYHGHIDDSLTVERVRKQSLRTALDAVLTNKTVETAETKAFGCAIKRQKVT